jgi:hypothetical protein
LDEDDRTGELIAATTRLRLLTTSLRIGFDETGEKGVSRTCELVRSTMVRYAGGQKINSQGRRWAQF